MITIIAELKAQAGKGGELAELLKNLAEQVRANEKGCLQYDPAVSLDDEDVVFVIEQYTDEDALKEHGSSSYFREAGKKFGALLGGAPKIHKFTG